MRKKTFLERISEHGKLEGDLFKTVRRVSEALERVSSGEEFDKVLQKYRGLDGRLKSRIGLSYRDYEKIIQDLKKDKYL
jgi:CRISPR/Cas system-associated protein Cas7 (RAMP superfamily)